MKPRVFISSTYYDLKHVRERLERFVNNLFFEPVLFESDNVIFEQGKSLDISCYDEVIRCQMMILIIGGRYGSAVNGENVEEKKTYYNREYVSITRREYETAIKNNIPVFIFVDKNVHAEYQTFRRNMHLFENPDTLSKSDFTFAHVDDINVFKFISAVSNNAIKTFERVEEIENYLGNQIAGMLYLYLDQLKQKGQGNKILDAVSELQNISKQMNTMIQAVGKDVIQNDTYEEVIFKQNQIIIEYFVDHFVSNIDFDILLSLDEAQVLAPKIYRICKESILNYDLLKHLEDSDVKTWYLKYQEVRNVFEEKLKKLDARIIVRHLYLKQIYNNYSKNIYPIISQDRRLQDILDDKIIEALIIEIADF